MNKSRHIVTPIIVLMIGVTLAGCASGPAQLEDLLTVEPGAPTQKESDQPTETTVSVPEVEANNSLDSCWVILKGVVYDFTPVVQQHPFGVQLSQAVCGRDSTQLLSENTDLDELLQQISPLKVGTLIVG